MYYYNINNNNLNLIIIFNNNDYELHMLIFFNIGFLLSLLHKDLMVLLALNY